jgi:WD40 repeat protein
MLTQPGFGDNRNGYQGPNQVDSFSDLTALPNLAIPPGFKLLYTLASRRQKVNLVSWSPDGQWLASGSNETMIRLWNPTTGAGQCILAGHTAPVRCMAWSFDGRMLASGSYDRTVRVWDPATGALLYTLGSHTHWISSVTWSSDGQRLASGSYDGTIKLWDSTTGILLSTLKGHTHRVASVAFSPDGKRLASGSFDGTVRLWNPETNTQLFALIGHNSPVNLIVWSPDGKGLASGSSDGTVRLWNAKTGARLHTLEGHRKAVKLVAWSPDGRLLLTGSSGSSPYDAEIFFWRTDTLEFLALLAGFENFVSAVWHPHFPVVVTSGKRGGDIAVWHLDLDHLFGISPSLLTAHYANAKVVLIGDSGVGKSGLGLVLSGKPFSATESTHARHVWIFDNRDVAIDEQRKETRETLLWDLAGQSGYRLIHQLSLHEVAVALVVFDAQSETDPFSGVRYWNAALKQALRIQGGAALPLKKLLIAARLDRGGVVIGRGS